VRYADPGYVLYVREGALMAHAFDEKALALEGEPRIVLDSVAVNTAFGMFSVSDTGVLVVRPPRRQNTLRRVDATGRLLSQISAPEATGALRVSPDGERVAASIADPKVGTFDIWAYGIQRPTQERVVVHGAHDQSAVWSRDGSQILFSSDRSGYPDIFAVPSDGSGDARVLLGGPGTQTPYDVSPDGSTLIYGSSSSGGGGSADLYVTPLGGSGTPRPFVVAPRRQGDARFSPDGRQVAYLSVETGRVELYVRPFPGPGRARQISTTGVDAPPLWSRDGQTLMFVSGRRVYRVRMGANGTPLGEHEVMFELAYDLSNWDLAPDGTFIMALATEERDAPPLRVVTDWPRLLRE
jgi:Tol biopolymer transport system component